MLLKVNAIDVIKALKPLLANTPISKSAEPRNWNDVYRRRKSEGEFLKTYFDDLATRIEWTSCPDCQREFNASTMEAVCVACADIRTAAEKVEHDNGEYLFRAIGPYGVEKYRFDNFSQDAGNMVGYQACKDFNPLTDNLYLHGLCGIGKTHLAGAVLKASSGKGFPVKWITPIYLGRGLRTRFASEEEAFIENIASYPVLVIDDVGVGRDSYAILQAIYEILEKRRNRKLNGLILTSNHNLSELSSKYGDDRLSSRIGGLCRVVAMMGVDRRVEQR